MSTFIRRTVTLLCAAALWIQPQMRRRSMFLCLLSPQPYFYVSDIITSMWRYSIFSTVEFSRGNVDVDPWRPFQWISFCQPHWIASVREFVCLSSDYGQGSKWRKDHNANPNEKRSNIQIQIYDSKDKKMSLLWYLLLGRCVSRPSLPSPCNRRRGLARL